MNRDRYTFDEQDRLVLKDCKKHKTSKHKKNTSKIYKTMIKDLMSIAKTEIPGIIIMFKPFPQSMSRPEYTVILSKSDTWGLDDIQALEYMAQELEVTIKNMKQGKP